MLKNPLKNPGSGPRRKVLRFNVQFKSRLNQLSVSHESDKKVKNQTKNDQLIKSKNGPKTVRSVQKGEGDYSWKDLWKSGREKDEEADDFHNVISSSLSTNTSVVKFSQISIQ